MKKFELVKSEKIKVGKVTLYRVKALKDFGLVKDGNTQYYRVKEGDLGGYVQSENNLSHDGDAWVSQDGAVYEDAFVTDNALVFGNALVSGTSQIKGAARVGGTTQVSGSAVIADNAKIFNGEIADKAYVHDNAEIDGNVAISGNARIFGEAKVKGNNVEIKENARLYDKVKVMGNNICIMGNVAVNGYAQIRSNTQITKMGDYITFQDWWTTSGATITYTFSNDKYSIFDFCGDSKEFLKFAKMGGEANVRECKRIVKNINDIKKDLNK